MRRVGQEVKHHLAAFSRVLVGICVTPRGRATIDGPAAATGSPMRFVPLVFCVLWFTGCDCDPCGGMTLEIVDAMTGRPVSGAEATVAVNAHGRRHRVGERLQTGEYRLWVRAPGYRQVTETVDIPSGCADFETGECPVGGIYTVALERR